MKLTNVIVEILIGKIEAPEFWFELRQGENQPICKCEGFFFFGCGFGLVCGVEFIRLSVYEAFSLRVVRGSIWCF